MDTEHSIMRLGDGIRPRMHSYYDVCPESPDGTRLLTSAFDGPVPGPAQVVLSRIDGGDERVLSDSQEAIGHVGRFALWLDDHTVAMRAEMPDDGAAGWCTLDLVSGATATLPGHLRQWHIGRDRGLVQVHGGLANPQRLLQGIEVVNRAGTVINAFDVAHARAVHPQSDSLPPSEHLNFMNSKWDPAGERFFVVFTDEVYRRTHGLGMEGRFKCLMVAGAQGEAVRFLGDFTHHPHWWPDGSGVIALWQDSPNQDLVVYDIDNGKRSVVSSGLEGIHATITPDCRHVIIDQQIGQDRCHIVQRNLSSGSDTMVASFAHTRWNHRDGHHPHPVLSRDGTRIYVNGEDAGVCQVYVFALE